MWMKGNLKRNKILVSEQALLEGVCLNVAGRDSRIEVAGAGAGAGKGRG